MSIFENIKALASERGVSYTNIEKELWNKTGVMVKWETSFPRLDKIYDVAQYFSVPIEYFLTGERNVETERETELLKVFSSCDEQGKMEITRVALNERDRTLKEKTDSKGESVAI